MKISYRREMKHNYLIVDPEELIWRNYECRMLAGNSIEGVLRFQLRQMDDEVRFYYEITSKQPLERLLESQMIKTEEIRRLILGISAVLDRMEQYLLREGCVLLEPEYIYVEPESFCVWLCLVPGLERDFPEDYGKLLEYLLGKVDHQDKETVILAYGLYQETRKENYGMEDILRILRAEGGGERKQEQKGGEEDEQEFEKSENSGRILPAREQEYHEKECERGQPYQGQGSGVSPEKPSLWMRFRQWLNQRKEQEEVDPVRVPLEILFREEEESGQQVSGNRRRIQTDWPDITAERDTVLLTDLSQSGGQGLHYLRALDRGMEDITISYFPFIIGKQENLADYLLCYDTVSRLHVRIDQEGDGWKIQDLNSTNGTMVGGKLLENNESVEVHIGEEVRIAEFRYRFE